MASGQHAHNLRRGFQGNHPAVMATIDLHGHRKSEGVVALTSFLDQISRNHIKSRKDVWVTVVTGSGAHSQEGPVLRTAVQTLLEKRRMQYTVNRGKGSFTVNANSGVVFFEPGAPVDTKLIITDTPERIPALPKGPRFTALPGDSQAINDPMPCEVAATDKAIEESRQEQRNVFKDHKKEEKLMKKAVSMSILHAEREEEEETKQLQRAMSMSVLDCRNDDDYDDGDLRKALELSEQEFQHHVNIDDDYDDELQRALDLSQKVVCLEDEELLRIMEISKQEQEPEACLIALQGDIEEYDIA